MQYRYSGTEPLAPPDGTILSVGSSADREHIRGLRATIDLAPIGICHFDVNGQFLLVNQRLCEILGYPRDTLLAKTFQQISFPDDLQDCERVIARLAAGELTVYHDERRFQRPDGSTVWARISVSPIRDEHGAFAFFTGVAEDVTTLRRDEDARREAEERLQAALAASATGTFRWDIVTNAIAWDASLESLFALPRGDVVATLDQFLARVHDGDRDRVAAACAACARTGADFDEEFRIVRPDGTERWIRDKGRTFLDASGRPVYMTGACTDVTDRRRMEDKLRASEGRLRRIVDSGMIGVYYTNGACDIVDANAAFLEMLGYTADDVDSGRLNEHRLTPYSWRALDDAKRAETLEAGVTAPWEKELIASDGRAIPVVVAHARLDAHGDQCIGICLDISSAKAAEAEREHALALEREARVHAEQAMQLRDEVLGIVAHDLRNPVHTVAMSTSALQSLELDASQRERHLGIIRHAVRGMERLIRDLLDVRRLEAGSLEVRHEPVDLLPLLRDTVDAFLADASARGLALIGEVDPQLPLVLGDGDRLGQVLSNLIGNALKFTPAGGRIVVYAHGTGSEVELAVTDNGPGIPPRVLSTVFDRFWQADRTSRSGAGLGLAIAKGIVEAHGGHIWVESIVGSGSVFRFTVPRLDDDSAAVAAQRSERNQRRSRATDGRSRRSA
ncbi:MAG TPA: PAS domain S-box protein [Gemmatimonadaceae bacterium]|nr:PAS domain S-box protein [Gemmatimonadaceae bacterium]